MTTMIITAEKIGDEFQLLCDDGELAQEGLIHKSRISAYRDAALLWPANSTWEGHKVHKGYQIKTD